MLTFIAGGSCSGAVATDNGSSANLLSDIWVSDSSNFSR